MLKDLFSLVTIVALLFSSCSKSEEEENGDDPQPTKQTVYFGVNLSGAEFGNVYPGVDGTHYGYPTEKKTWTISKPKASIWYVFHSVGNAYNPQ